MKKILLTLILFFFTSMNALAVDYSKYKLSDINSISKATKAYQEEFKNKKHTKEAEKEYLRFWSFYVNAVEKQDELIKLETPNKLNKDSYYWQAQQYSQKYFEKGLRIDYNGEFYVTTSNEYLYHNFCPYLGADWCELLKYRSELDKKILTWDFRYVITKKQVTEILNFYKGFLKKYPNYISVKDIKYIINSYENDLKHYPYLDY